MPRPKGSKNRKSITLDSAEVIEEKIAAAEASIDQLSADLKARKSELKDLLKEREAALKAAAEKKAAEDQAAILAALEKSGKTVQEILDFLK